jgi:hypothetical protein
MVEDEYRAHLAQPTTQRALAQGQTSHVNEMNKLVGAKFKVLAANLKSAAKIIKDQTPGGVVPPHQESGFVAPEHLPVGKEAKTKALDEARKQGTGTEDDVSKMIDILIPATDPLLRE